MTPAQPGSVGEPVASVRVEGGMMRGATRRPGMASLPDGDHKLYAAGRAVEAALRDAPQAEPDCAGGMPCTDCPNKRKCQAGCMRQEEALERPNQEEPSQRHPLDVEALHELQKVMADFGGDWPDVPGEQEVVRRAKMLSRLWKADRLIDSGRIEAAAKVLTASMCYQWDSMLEEDRDTMRKTAEAIIRATNAAATPDQNEPDAWECSGCGGSGKQTAYDAHGFGHNLAYFVPCGVCDGVGFCGPDAARRAAEAKPAPKVSESRPVLYSDEYVTQQPEAPETGAVGWTHWEARIKQLMEDIGQPNSRSVYQALSQLVNEASRLAAAQNVERGVCPTGVQESAVQEMYERSGGKDWMREPNAEMWRAIASIGFKWGKLLQQQRHPQDVAALYELQSVMADFGGDWPDAPGEQEVVRRAKMLSRLWKSECAPTEAKPAQDAVDAVIPLDKDELAQLIAEHLGGTYHCTRVWEAWNVGTMSRDDFEPVDESETPTEIADAIIDAIRAAISAAISAKKGGAA